MRKAIYPGSFDPITNGHLDVITRASLLFDELIVAVAVNSQKKPLFDSAERVAIIEQACTGLDSVKVVSFDGLIVEFAKEKGALALVRGLRAVSDFEFEFQMALMNRHLEPALETIFLTPQEEYTYLSSRLVKEVCRLGGDITELVPANVSAALDSKYKS